MHRIDRAISSITEDRRAAYLFDTKIAADAVGCHPNKFSDWWFRNKAKLTALFMAQPGETAAELAALIALAAAEKERNTPPRRK